MLRDQNGTNVGPNERNISIWLGLLVAIFGIRRAWGSMLVTGLGGYLIYRGITGNCKVYEKLDVDTTRRSLIERLPTEKLGDMLPTDKLASMLPTELFSKLIKIEETVTVNRPPAEVFLFWRNLENLPRFMEYLQSVTITSPTTSHWVAKTPVGGLPLAWDAEITEEIPNEYLAWRSQPDSTVKTQGGVRFTPALGGGTEVHVFMNYTPPAGPAGAAIAKVINGITAKTVKEDLRRFKEVMDGGDLAGQSKGQALAEESARDRAHSMPSGPAGEKPGSEQSRMRDVVHKASEDSFPASDPPSYSHGID